MDRTGIGDLQQALALLGIERAAQVDGAGDVGAGGGFAVGIEVSSTSTDSSGHCLRAAYMRSVIAVHAPNAESSR